MSWLSEIRKRRRDRRLRYAVASAIAVVVFIGLSGALQYVAYRYLGKAGLGLMVDAIAGIAAIVFGVVAALGLKPVVGREPPEHEAAKAFFEGRDVRSDDGKFEEMD